MRPHQDHRRGGEVQAEADRQRHAIAAEGIAQEVDSIGGQLDAFTSKEYAGY